MPATHAAKAAQDEDVAVELRHGPDHLLEQNLIKLGRGLRFGRSLKLPIPPPSAFFPALIADQIQGDREQKRLRVADVVHRIARGANIGLLNDIGRRIGIDMGAQATIQPGGIAPVETVDTVLRLCPKLLRIGHHSSPASRREGPEPRRVPHGPRQARRRAPSGVGNGHTRDARRRR